MSLRDMLTIGIFYLNRHRSMCERLFKDDVENVIKLIYETLLNIKGQETFSYFD